MKPILASASALAMILTATACSDTTDTTDSAAYDTADEAYGTTDRTDPSMTGTDTANMDDRYNADGNVIDTTGTMSNRQAFMLGTDEVLASDLMDAGVQNQAGEQVAKVADVWLGANRSSPVLIIQDDGLTGLGGQRYMASFSEVTMTPTTGQGEEPNVMIQLRGDSIETLPEYEQDGLNDYTLVTEMIGTTAEFTERDDSARIDDLILSTSGEPRYAVVSEGLLSTDQIVIDADNIIRAEGDSDGELVITISEDVFEQAEAYREQ